MYWSNIQGNEKKCFLIVCYNLMKNCYDWPNANCENYVFLFRTIVLYNGISINKRVGFFMNMKYSRCLNDSTYLPNMIGVQVWRLKCNSIWRRTKLPVDRAIFVLTVVHSFVLKCYVSDILSASITDNKH